MHEKLINDKTEILYIFIFFSMNSGKTRMTHLGPMKARDKVRAVNFKIQVREIKQEVQ